MKKLQVIAGNCVLENLKTSMETSSFLKEMSEKFNFDLMKFELEQIGRWTRSEIITGIIMVTMLFLKGRIFLIL